MKTIIVGISGVGKTTVIEKAKEKLSEYQTINFGTKMLETARKQGLVENRDQLRKLSPKKTKKLQKKTAKEIKKKKNLLIDTHLAIESKKGITPGMPKWIVEKINLDRVILIEAEPEKIKERRKKDKTRKRNDFKLTPKQHQKINRYYAATISTLTGAPVKIIKNRENQAEKAANEMIKTLKK